MRSRLRSRSIRTSLTLACFVLTGCNSGPVPTPRLESDSAQNRQLQTRLFVDVSEPKLLAACAGALQDMGFVLDESEARLGVITASRGCPDRTLSLRSTAKPLAAGDVALGVVLVAAGVAFIAANPGIVLGGLLSGPSSHPPPPRPEQIRVTLVISPTAARGREAFFVRATFHSVLSTESGDGARVVSGEPVNTPAFYREFFGKLTSNLPGKPQTT
jgi:hypothetical protein